MLQFVKWEEASREQIRGGNGEDGRRPLASVAANSQGTIHEALVSVHPIFVNYCMLGMNRCETRSTWLVQGNPYGLCTAVATPSLLIDRNENKHYPCSLRQDACNNLLRTSGG